MFLAGGKFLGLALGASKQPADFIKLDSGEFGTARNASVPLLRGKCGKKLSLTRMAIVVGRWLDNS